jgi:hypothetical protein
MRKRRERKLVKVNSNILEENVCVSIASAMRKYVFSFLFFTKRRKRRRERDDLPYGAILRTRNFLSHHFGLKYGFLAFPII